MLLDVPVILALAGGCQLLLVLVVLILIMSRGNGLRIGFLIPMCLQESGRPKHLPLLLVVLLLVLLLVVLLLVVMLLMNCRQEEDTHEHSIQEHGVSSKHCVNDMLWHVQQKSWVYDPMFF